MKAIEQKKSSIIRLFENDKEYGDIFVFSLFCTYYGKFNETVYLEGLKDNVTFSAWKALKKYFKEQNVKNIKWEHKNKNNHEVTVCYDIVNNKMKSEYS